jgi:GTPase
MAGLSTFLGSLESRVADAPQFGDMTGLAQIDLLRFYNIEGAGIVVVGVVKTGTAKVGQTLTLGPLKHNASKQVIIRSIHFNYLSIETAFPGQICAFAIKAAKKKEELLVPDFRKGAVLVDSPGLQKHSQGFQADISVLHHSSSIKTGFQSLMHCGVVSQVVQIIKMDKDCLKTGDVARATFRFLHYDEYLLPNSYFLLCDGSTRTPQVLGVISRVHTSKAELETFDLGELDKSPDP